MWLTHHLLWLKSYYCACTTVSICTSSINLIGSFNFIPVAHQFAKQVLIPTDPVLKSVQWPAKLCWLCWSSPHVIRPTCSASLPWASRVISKVVTESEDSIEGCPQLSVQSHNVLYVYIYISYKPNCNLYTQRQQVDSYREWPLTHVCLASGPKWQAARLPSKQFRTKKCCLYIGYTAFHFICWWWPAGKKGVRRGAAATQRSQSTRVRHWVMLGLGHVLRLILRRNSKHNLISGLSCWPTLHTQFEFPAYPKSKVPKHII